ncbi:MAG: protein kinase, partial [Elusimicrobia bacterium]|nr:protein kinase [Elusimicrobiota bacterium]
MRACGDCGCHNSLAKRFCDSCGSQLDGGDHKQAGPSPQAPAASKPETLKPERFEHGPSKPQPAKPEPAKPEPAKPEPAKPERAKKPQETLTLGPGAGPSGPAEPGPLSWKPGDVIDDLYEVRDVLGEGGFGSVHKVYHRGWRMELAVKAPRPDRVSNRKALELFVQEANTWVGLGLHPHIATCYYVRLMGVPRIFVEYMAGGTLADWLKQYRVPDAKSALDFAVQIARAMEYAHSKRLVHRDLKPGNCLMTPGGGLKITDFGLAKVGDEADLAGDVGPEAPVGAKIAKVKEATQTGRLGTPEYMSPEQWHNPRSAGPAADAWAFGVLLYELCCGKKPFEMDDGEPVDAFFARLVQTGWRYERPRGLPIGVGELIEGCLREDAARRLADFKAFGGILATAYESVAKTPYTREAPRPALLADTLNNQGVSMSDLGRSDEALKLFDQALKLDPTHAGAIYNRGALLLSAGKAAESELLSRLGQAKTARPRDWVAPFLLGLVHLRRKDARAALQELKEARELSLPHDNPLVARAEQRARSGAPEGPLEPFVALPTGAEGAVLEESAFKALLSRAKAEADSGAAGKAYQSVLKARRLKGYERAGEAMDLLRRLGAKGERRTLRAAWQSSLLHESSGALGVAACLDGRLLATGHQDKLVRVWDARGGSILRTLQGHAGAVRGVAFPPDGRFLLSGAGDGSLRVWDLRRGECARVLVGHQGPVTSIALSPDGRQALSASADMTVRLWDIETAKVARTFVGHRDIVNSVCFSPDGNLVFSAADDGIVRVWKARTGAVVREFDGHGGPARSVAVSPDGALALSGGARDEIMAWEPASDRADRVFVGLGASVNSVCFTPDGRFALCAGEDKTVRIWDFPRAESSWRFEGHMGPIHSLCVSPDGNFAFTAGPDGVRTWELDWEWTFADVAQPAPQRTPETSARALEVRSRTATGRTPAPGGRTPVPGGRTPVPGGRTPVPGTRTPAPVVRAGRDPVKAPPPAAEKVPAPAPVPQAPPLWKRELREQAGKAAGTGAAILAACGRIVLAQTRTAADVGTATLAGGARAALGLIRRLA